MKKISLILLSICLTLQSNAQEKKTINKVEPPKGSLPTMQICMLNEQGHAALFVENLKDQSKENDVNSIINDAEKYLDSTSKSRAYVDVLLRKEFVGIRNFFLTVTNKTTVATSFLYSDVPFHFCMYNDTALSLYISAMKDGDTYNAKDKTEKQIASAVFADCVLPALQALGEFKDNELKYFGLSIYYGCKDDKGAASNIKPYCMTFVVRLADIKRYIDGSLTVDDMVDNAAVYISKDDTKADLRKIRVNLE